MSSKIQKKPKKKEVATARARLYPSTYKYLRVRAVREGTTVAELVEKLRQNESV